MSTRDAEQSDLAAMCEIHVTAWRAAYAGLMPQGFLDGMTDAHAMTRLKPAMAHRPARVLVVEDGSRLIGFSRLGPSREDDVPARTGEVFAINIAPSHWRRGFGSTLLRASLLRLAELGNHQATLWVLESNKRACRFYDTEGLLIDGATRIEAVDTDWPLRELRYRVDLPHQSRS